MHIFHAAVATALFSFACATSGAGYSHVNVKTVALQPGARDASGIQPVADVSVALKCPGAQDKALGTTQADGTLRVDADQNVPLACSLALAQAGYQPVEYKITSVCTETSQTNCTALDVRAVLRHAREQGSAGAKQ